MGNDRNTLWGDGYLHSLYYKIKRPLVAVPILTSGLSRKAPVSLRRYK